MLKKITKLCLATAACALVAGQVSAADVKSSFSGRALGYFQNYSEKISGETVTKNDFDSNGRLGASLTATEGEWTVGGFVEIDSKAMSSRDQSASIENNTFKLEIGRMYRAGITKGGRYYNDVTTSAFYYIGEQACSYDGCRIDSVNVSLKDLGLSVQIGMNQTSGSNIDDTDTGVDEAATMDENYYQVQWGKSFGSLDLAAQLSYVSTSIDEDRSSANASAKDSNADGATKNSFSVAADFGLSETLNVAVGLDSKTEKTGEDGADALNQMIIQAGVDLALDAASGVSAKLGLKTADVTKDESVTYTKVTVGYSKDISGLKLFANIANETGKNDDANVDVATREIAAGLRYDF